MELPKGIQLSSGNIKTHVLRLIKNLYGQKQAGRVWNQHLSKGLQKAGFVASKVDECVIYKGKTIFIVYVDDGIFFGPDLKAIAQAMKNLDAQGFNLDLMGDVKDYLGINFERLAAGRVKMSQPQLLEQILKRCGAEPGSQHKEYPLPSVHLATIFAGGGAWKGKFHYRSVMGKLNFLEKGTRPDITYATHQCTRFSEETRASHEDDDVWLCKYLLATKDYGIIYDPKREQSIQAYADAEFCGSWNKATAPQDISTSKSRTGYIIHFVDYPIIWTSKLQMQIALSTTNYDQQCSNFSGQGNTVMLFTITVLDLVVVIPRYYMPYISITMITHRLLIGWSNPHIL
jgi:hypothetical protein